MTEHEAFQLIIDLETRAGEQGDYFVTALFAFVVVIYLAGKEMTKAMIAVTCIIYSAYAFLNIAAVWAAMNRIVKIQEMWPSSMGATSAPDSAVYFVPLFWLSVWGASMFFMTLVLRRSTDSPEV
jgi:hypothetical protein